MRLDLLRLETRNRHQITLTVRNRYDLIGVVLECSCGYRSKLLLDPYLEDVNRLAEAHRKESLFEEDARP